LDGLLIGEESFLLLGLGKADTGANLSAVKMGLSERAGKAPGPAVPAKRRESASLWNPLDPLTRFEEVGGAGDTDLGVGAMSNCSDWRYRAPLEKLRGNAGGNFGG